MSWFSSGNQKGLTFNKLNSLYADLNIFKELDKIIPQGNLKSSPSPDNFWANFSLLALRKVRHSIYTENAVFVVPYEKLRKKITNYDRFISDKRYKDKEIIEVFNDEFVKTNYIPNDLNFIVLFDDDYDNLKRVINDFFSNSQTIKIVLSGAAIESNFSDKVKAIQDAYERLGAKLREFSEDLDVTREKIRLKYKLAS